MCAGKCIDPTTDAANEAGILAGDVLVKLGDDNLESQAHLIKLLQKQIDELRAEVKALQADKTKKK